METEKPSKHPHSLPWVVIFIMFFILIGVSLAVFGVQNSFAPSLGSVNPPVDSPPPFTGNTVLDR